MNSFRDRLVSFMQGRYGYDRFTRFLIGLSFVFWALCFFARFTPWYWLYFVFSFLNFAIYAYAIFRIFSKNIASRTLENERYLQFCSRFLPKFDRFKTKLTDSDHCYKNCPACGALLRLRRIRGKHTTRCPQCGHKFSVHIFFGDKA